MAQKISKEETEDIVRLWDFSQIMEALEKGIPAENLVNGKKGDVLLGSILGQSEALFKYIMSKPFDFTKNNFSYVESAMLVASTYNDYLYINALLDKMSLSQLQVREQINLNTNLHIACEQGLQNIALKLSHKGLSWEAVNSKKQTPLHILLRKVNFINKDLLKELQGISIRKKDNMGLSCRDIIKSFSHNKEWISFEENQQLLEVFDIK